MSPGKWQVVVGISIVVLDFLMIAVLGGMAQTYSSHAEALDESTVDACVEQAEAADGALPIGRLAEREVDFDGQGVIRVRYPRDGRADLVIRCRYSLPDDEKLPPTIEDVWVTKE